MTETRNIIGTSEEAFRIGLSGPAIYQGTADPTVTPPTPVDPSGFNNGDVYFRTFTGSESIWQFKSGGWEESGTMFFSSSATFGAGAQILADPSAGPGAPAYSFDTDADTGIFLPSPDTIGFSVGSTPVFNIEADGTLNALTASYETLVLADNDIPNKKYTDDTFFAKTGGTLVGDLVLDTGVVVELDPAAGAGSPPLTFTGDTDTGVFRPLPNVLGFTTGGVEMARVNSSGLTVTAGNQFIGQTGSSAAPSFAISGSATGWNFDGSDLVQVISGVDILTLSTATLTGSGLRFRASDGTDLLPGFAFAGTIDTGMFRDAGDLGFSTTTNGEVLRIDDATGVLTVGVAGYESSVSGSSNDIPNVIYVENNFLDLTGGTVAGVLTISGAQFLSSSGSSGTPGISFSAATTAGFFLSGGTDIGFTVGGSAVAAFGSTFATFILPIEAPDGSAAAPGIVWDSDNDTGIFYGGSTGETGVSSDGDEIATFGPAGLAINNVNATEIFKLPSYTLATLPAVSAGGMIFVSDAAAGAGRIAYGNTAAAAWIDPQTGVAVVA